MPQPNHWLHRILPVVAATAVTVLISCSGDNPMSADTDPVDVSSAAKALQDSEKPDEPADARDLEQRCRDQVADMRAKLRRLEELRERFPVLARTYTPQIEELEASLERLIGRCRQALSEDEGDDDGDIEGALERCFAEQRSLHAKIRRLEQLKARFPVLARVYNPQLEELRRQLRRLEERCGRPTHDRPDDDGVEDGNESHDRRRRECEEREDGIEKRIERLEQLADRFPVLARVYNPQIAALERDLDRLEERCGFDEGNESGGEEHADEDEDSDDGDESDEGDDA